MFLTAKAFTVKPAENHLGKTGNQLLCHSWVANSGKNSVNSKITSERSINQSRLFVTHNTIQTTKCMKRKFLYDVTGFAKGA